MEPLGRALRWHGQNCVTQVEDLRKIVNSIARDDGLKGRERRSKRRFNFVSNVSIQAVNLDHQPVGLTYTAVTRDISTGGLRLLSPALINTPFLVVKIPLPSGPKKLVLLEVLRCRPFRNFYEVGGQFVAEP